jgi:cytochrome c peroxidase
VTGKRQDLYKFRTPSLREVAGTGPYMHDGSQATLFDVVQYYYRGVPRRGPEGLALDVEALVDRSFSEIDALVAFLKSLSGEPLQIEPPKLP